jgi:hypothetical protein
MIRRASHGELGAAARRTLLLTLILLLAGCDGRELKALPGEMVGEWKTDESRYHGRLMRLETDRITFGLGGIGPDKTELIEKISIANPDNPTDYAIRLKSEDGTPDAIVLQFTADNGGELRLKNQPKVVWKRKNEPSRTPPSEALKPEALPRESTQTDHKTIYKIDCLRTKLCRSY